MKTIRQWLEELPEPYRTQAINNTASVKDLDLEVENLDEALYQAFLWYESPEGYDYWSDLEESLFLNNK